MPAPDLQAPGSIDVDVSFSGLRVPLTKAAVRQIVDAVFVADGVESAEVSVTFVDDEKSAEINEKYLGHSGPTDIITFEMSSHNGIIVGDIYIAPSVARANAKEHGVNVREEFVRLVVHGALHVLGYEHPEDETRVNSPMWTKQEKFVVTLIPAIAGTR